jgi:LCP family protein required for cell wall assembly
MALREPEKPASELPPPRTSVARKTGRAAGGRPTTRRPYGSSRRAPRRTLGRALLATAASAVAPGSGHLMLKRTRIGALILAVFLLVLTGLVALLFSSGRAELLQTALSTNVLVGATVGLVVGGLAWMAVIVHTYLIARPRSLALGRQVIGVGTVAALCLVVAAPLGFAANLANSQRTLIDSLFTGGGGTAAAEAITKPRLNILLVGSDAGPDRKGARTDTMMVASIDTKTGRTVLFGLPRNIQFAQFPPGSPMAEKFPRGFHDNADPLSGNYLLNAVYAWGLDYPDMAPDTPTDDPGLNLLHQTISYMLGLQIDYYVDVNMAGFASIIDALGGLTVDVGPDPLPIGGITPSGQHVKPDGYIPPGVQQLSGEMALAFARSRTNSDDYTRMGRQRCLIQYVLQQKSPTDMLTNFQGVAAATTNSVATNIPQEVLPGLVGVAANGVNLESISFDPNLPDPEGPDGHFSTAEPNFPYMRQVVQDAINRPPAPPAPTAGAAPTGSPAAAPTSAAPQARSSTSAPRAGASDTATTAAAPTSLAETCAGS